MILDGHDAAEGSDWEEQEAEAILDPLPISEDPVEERRRTGWKVVLLVGFVLLLVALRQWTPLAQYLDPDRLQALGATISAHPAAPALVIGAFWLGAMLFLPLTLLILSVAVVFPPLPAFVYAMAGSLGSAVMGYAIGRRMGAGTAHRISQGRFNRMRGWLQRQGTVSVAVLRNIPVAPYTIMNIIAGAAPMRLPAFVGGTLFGLAPSTIILAFMGTTVNEVLAAPDWGNVTLLVVLLLAVVGMSWVIKRRFAMRRLR